MTWIRPRLTVRRLAWVLLLLGGAAFGRAPELPAGGTADAWMRRATAAERAGLTNEAVSAYENLLRRDAAFEAVVAPRLISLYIGGNQAAPALSWAARVSRKQPDPKAYLAGVHARLGQFKEAELLLRQTLQETRNAPKRVALLWQLADVLESQGDRESALATLSDAQSEAADDHQRLTATQRLEALRNRPVAALAKQPSARRQPQAGDTP